MAKGRREIKGEIQKEIRKEKMESDRKIQICVKKKR